MVLFLAVLGVCAAAGAQTPAPPKPRYGIAAQVEGYPQATPQAALASVIRAVDKERFEYLAAHLIDPKVIDGRVGERARILNDEVDRELRLVREAQINQRVGRRERLPDDPVEFTAAVTAEARQRAFRAVIRTIGGQLAESPGTLREFRKFARVGVLNETGDTAALTLRGTSGEQISFRKEGSRWFVDDRKGPEPVQQPTPPPAP